METPTAIFSWIQTTTQWAGLYLVLVIGFFSVGVVVWLAGFATQIGRPKEPDKPEPKSKGFDFLVIDDPASPVLVAHSYQDRLLTWYEIRKEYADAVTRLVPTDPLDLFKEPSAAKGYGQSFDDFTPSNDILSNVGNIEPGQGGRCPRPLLAYDPTRDAYRITGQDGKPVWITSRDFEEARPVAGTVAKEPPTLPLGWSTNGRPL